MFRGRDVLLGVVLVSGYSGKRAAASVRRLAPAAWLEVAPGRRWLAWVSMSRLRKNDRHQRRTSGISGDLWLKHTGRAVLPEIVQCVQGGTKLALAFATLVHSIPCARRYCDEAFVSAVDRPRNSVRHAPARWRCPGQHSHQSQKGTGKAT